MTAESAARFFDPMHDEDWPVRPQPEALHQIEVKACDLAHWKKIFVLKRN
ncbi:MAG TPA: hypothetical protein VNC39_12180 [Acidocella sp.]|jgi:hypothetical protein|nr:hypothetical protein [Acidocella sp.]HVE22727.1 hypothetical protein [Acidocella sp.]